MDDDQELMGQVLDELFQAMDTKNKELFMEAMKAIVLNILDEDKEGEDHA